MQLLVGLFFVLSLRSTPLNNQTILGSPTQWPVAFSGMTDDCPLLLVVGVPGKKKNQHPGMELIPQFTVSPPMPLVYARMAAGTVPRTCALLSVQWVVTGITSPLMGGASPSGAILAATTVWCR